MVKTYWTNMVEASGGKTSTKNTKEKNNLEVAEWVVEAVNKGLYELFPKRFTSDGTDLESCQDVKGEWYFGKDNCAKVLLEYKTVKCTPTVCYDTLAKATEAGKEACFTDNDGGLAQKVGKANCGLKPMLNGMF